MVLGAAIGDTLGGGGGGEGFFEESPPPLEANPNKVLAMLRGGVTLEVCSSPAATESLRITGGAENDSESLRVGDCPGGGGGGDGAPAALGEMPAGGGGGGGDTLNREGGGTTAGDGWMVAAAVSTTGIETSLA